MEFAQTPIRFRYTNHRGETEMRCVTPRQFLFGKSQYHPEPQWLLVGWCEDRKAIRHFALKDCDFTAAADE